jgi:hypothetical protein
VIKCRWTMVNVHGRANRGGTVDFVREIHVSRRKG